MMPCDFTNGLKCDSCPFGSCFECPTVDSEDELWELLHDLYKKFDHLEKEIKGTSEE